MPIDKRKIFFSGFPPILCIKYFLDDFVQQRMSSSMWSHLKVYFFLSDYHHWRPTSEDLFFDLLFLSILAFQEKNFLHEQQEIFVLMMGSNRNEDTTRIQSNLIHDFLTNLTLTFGNRLKSFFFLYIFWFILIYLYILIIYHHSFCYVLVLLQCFYFLWYGQEFLQRPFSKQKSIWRLLILSLFATLFGQLLFQPYSCVLIEHVTPSIHQLLSNILDMSCFIEQFQKIYSTECSNNASTDFFHPHRIYCQSKKTFLFDAVAFLFLLLFVRLLNSSMFHYVRLELEVENQLSQMGASLLSQLNRLKLIEYRQRSSQELESIKRRVTEIRERRVRKKIDQSFKTKLFLFV